MTGAGLLVACRTFGPPDVVELQLPPSLAIGHVWWDWWELKVSHIWRSKRKSEEGETSRRKHKDQRLAVVSATRLLPSAGAQWYQFWLSTNSGHLKKALHQCFMDRTNSSGQFGGLTNESLFQLASKRHHCVCLWIQQAASTRAEKCFKTMQMTMREASGTC